MKIFVKNNIIHFMDMMNLIKPTKKPFVLMYHRIIENPDKELIPCQPGMYVTKKAFENQLKFLNDNFEILPLIDLLKLLFDNKNVSKCCSLTFDDGWVDNYINAYNLLKKNKTPASFFLATSYIGTLRKLWSENIAIFLKYSNNEMKKSVFVDLLEDRIFIKLLFNINELNFSYNLTEIVKYLKYIDKKIKNDIFINLNKYIDEMNLNIRMMMNWDEVLQMNKSSLFNFYPHTHNHKILTLLNDDEISYEISTSINTVKKMLNNVDVDIFCFPSGASNDNIVKILEGYNIKYAIGTNYGHLGINKSKFNIPRIGIHDDISNSNYLFKFCIR